MPSIALKRTPLEMVEQYNICGKRHSQKIDCINYNYNTLKMYSDM